VRYLSTIVILLFVALTSHAQSKYGANDTLLVPYIVYGGDTMTYAQLDMVTVFGEMSPEQRRAKQKWTRLRNAVYVTYPYAIKEFQRKRIKKGIYCTIDCIVGLSG
jgi:hypothetical protein